MNIQLHDKHAMVCGSTQGIGKAIALEFAQLGARVTLVARNEAILRQVQKELAIPAGQTHDYLCADFNDSQGLQRKVQEYVASQGAIHILVNNTGGPTPGPILEARPEEFQQAFANHLICNQLLVQALLPGMKTAGYGRIINIVSVSVKQPLKGLGVSNTIRWAVASWAKTLAEELGPLGITVNNVLPGYTNTARLASLIENKAKKQGKNVEEVARQMRAEVPLGRFAEPVEIASAVAFLASPSAAYINGINLPVDGGKTLCL